MGYVPQRNTVVGGIPSTVREVVAAGLVSPRHLLRRVRAADRAQVEEAIASVGLADKADEPLLTLSGGQQRRALVARALFSRNGDETLTAVTAALLASPPLAGRLRGDITTRIVRRTCCLHYRTSARRTCGDCPLTGSVAARRRA